MIKFLGGRFHMPGASFVIPDGYYIDSVPESAEEFALYFLPPDQSFNAVIGYEDDGEAEGALNEWMAKMDETEIIRAIAPMANDSLNGWDVLYSSGEDAYYEARFQLPDGNNMLYLIHSDPEAVEGIVAGPEYRKILDGIRREDTGIYGE